MKHQKQLGSLWVSGALWLSMTASILSSVAFAENDAKNGKVLYEKSKCQKCHGTEVFTREDRKVKSLKALETQVRMCDSQLSVNWFDEDISDVVAYLNRDYYKFDAKSNKEQDNPTKLAD